MSDNFAPIVTISAAKQIANALREAILDGRFAVDVRLPTEEELASRFGVSRPTIREALKRLAAENLVHSRRGPTGGNFVKKPSLGEIQTSLANSTMLLVSLQEFTHDEIAEARLSLESVCCDLACRHGRKSDFKAMREELARQLDPALTDVEFCASDVRFHVGLARATRNPLLTLVISAILEGLQPITNLIVFRFRDRALIASQHGLMLNALETRDAKSAKAVLEEQIGYLRTKYKEARAWRSRKESQPRRQHP